MPDDNEVISEQSASISAEDLVNRFMERGQSTIPRDNLGGEDANTEGEAREVVEAESQQETVQETETETQQETTQETAQETDGQPTVTNLGEVFDNFDPEQVALPDGRTIAEAIAAPAEEVKKVRSKAQEQIGAIRRAAETRMSAVDNLVLKQLKGIETKMISPDMQALREVNPGEWAAQKAILDDERNQTILDYREAQAHYQQLQQDTLRDQLLDVDKTLKEEEGWNDQHVEDALNVLLQAGVTKAELPYIASDARYVKLAYELAAYRKGKMDKAETTLKAMPTPKERGPKNSKIITPSKPVDKARAAHQKSRSVHSLEDVFMSRMHS